MTDLRLPINKSPNRYRYFRRPTGHDCNGVKDELFSSPKVPQVKGNIRLGHVVGTSTVLGVSKKELAKHLLACGASGIGKSNFLRVIQIELNQNNIPFLCFDTAKLGGRFLKKSMDDLIILRWNKDFFFNPLQPPPGVSLKEWVMVFCEITTEIFGLRTASMLYLTEFILSRLFGGTEKVQGDAIPTMHDLDRTLERRLKEKVPLNERGYINGIKGKVKAICITLDKMTHVHEGIPIPDLLKYPVCIELVGIKSSEIQYWLISLIMAAITSYRENRPISFGSLKHVFFIDEAAHIVGKGEK